MVYASDNSVTRGRSRYTALRGRQKYEYAIMPYTQRSEVQRAATDFHLLCQYQPLRGPANHSSAPRSFLSVEPEAILATALFVHRGHVYLRLWNASGQEATAAIHAGWAHECTSVDLRLRPDGKPVPPDRILLPPWGIRTVNIS